MDATSDHLGDGFGLANIESFNVAFRLISVNVRVQLSNVSIAE